MPEYEWMGAIELGGTKTVVAVGSQDGEILDEIRFPTTAPGETLGRAVEWLRERGGGLAGIGVASFGPVRVDPVAADYGTMLATPKEGWQGFPIAGALREAFPGVPVALDTDVNAAALAEARRGAGQGVEDLVYITVGTGIDGGVLSGGRLVHGALHPEFGHLKVPRVPGDDFPGVCPFHGDCLEGMASGPAIRERWGREGKDLAESEAAWEVEAWYLAHGILSLVAVLCPARVVLGGGVPQASGLHERVNQRLAEIAAGYFPVIGEAGDYVVPPGLGQQAGIIGALLLAER